jgi:hypothetical protein
MVIQVLPKAYGITVEFMLRLDSWNVFRSGAVDCIGKN